MRRTEVTNRINRLLLIVAIILFSIFIITSIITQRGLYADGVFFLLAIIDQASDPGYPIFDDSKHIRLFINFLNQLLPSLTVFFKIGNFQIINYLFNINIFLMPLAMALIVFYISKSIHKAYFSIIVFASFIYFVFGSFIFILNQAITFSFVLWGIFIYTFMDRQPKSFDWILVSALLVLTFRGHEMILTVAPVILLAIVWNFNEKHKLLKYFNSYIFTFITLSFLWAVYWQLSHQVGHQTNSFLYIVFRFLDYGVLFDSILSVPIIGIVLSLFITSLYFRKKNYTRIINVAIWLFICFSSYIVIKKTFFDITSIHIEFDYRIFITFGIPVMMLLTVLYQKLDLHFMTSELLIYLIRIVLISGIFLTIWQLKHNYYWNSFLHKIKENIEVSNHFEIDSDYFSIPLDNGIGRYSWGWCWPHYSIIAQKGDVSKIIIPVEQFRKKYYDISLKENIVLLPYRKFKNDQYLDFTKLMNSKYMEVQKQDRSYSFSSSFSYIKNIEGFSQRLGEDFGWTENQKASFQIDLISSPAGDVEIKLNGRAFVNKQHKEQKVHFYINGHKILTKIFKYTDKDHLYHTTELFAAKELIPSNELNIQFVFENSISPAELGTGKDKRQLGIAIKDIHLEIK